MAHCLSKIRSNAEEPSILLNRFPFAAFVLICGRGIDYSLINIDGAGSGRARNALRSDVDIVCLEDP